MSDINVVSVPYPTGSITEYQITASVPINDFNISLSLYGSTYRFEPMYDITAMEAVRFSQFLSLYPHYASTGCDVQQSTQHFIERHNLLRHFIKV